MIPSETLVLKSHEGKVFEIRRQFGSVPSKALFGNCPWRALSPSSPKWLLNSVLNKALFQNSF